MEFKIEPYKVYIKINEKGHITEVNSSAFISDVSDWIEIDEGCGDKYHHAQGNYFDRPVVNVDGIHNYIYENGTVRETTEEEKEEERASFPSQPISSDERIEQLETQLEATQEVLDALLMGDITL